MKICKYILILIILMVFSIIFIYRLSANIVPNQLTIATGHKSGGYYQYALKYKEVFKEENIDIQIVETNGSEEALELLYNKKVDLAFIQGGVAQNKHKEKLFSLGSVFYEPLWVFYNDALDITYLSDLKDKKVSVGVKGSGTKMIFETLLNENGIKKDSLLNLNSHQAVDKLINKEIDAICLVLSSESPIVKKLFNSKGIKLMDFKRQEAYKGKFAFINSLQLAQGVIDLHQNIPSENKNLLGTTASLVANDNINYNLQRLILKRIKEVHYNGGIFEPKHYFPSKYYVDIPISKHAMNYIDLGETWSEKHLPFWFSSIIEALILLLIPLIPLLILFWKFVLPSYKIYLRHKYFKYKKELRKMHKDTEEEREILALRVDEIDKSIKLNCFAFILITGLYHDLVLEIESIKNQLNDFQHDKEDR